MALQDKKPRKVDDDDSSIEGGDDERYAEFFHSVRTSTGLEIGVKVTWPQVDQFEISTCLPQDAIAPMFNGTAWAGTRVWRAAIVALQFMLCDECPVKLFPDTTVLELGCGLGVPGMLLGLIHKCQVILTDKDSLVEQMEQNLNKLQSSHDASTIQAAPLDWSIQGVRDLLKSSKVNDSDGFDIVLNCDCIYEPLYGESWKFLADCQEELLRSKPKSFMITSVERRRVDGVDLYLERMRSSELVEKVEQIKLPFDAPEEVEVYRIFGKIG
jgi:hypothetical protein